MLGRRVCVFGRVMTAVPVPDPPAPPFCGSFAAAVGSPAAGRAPRPCWPAIERIRAGGRRSFRGNDGGKSPSVTSIPVLETIRIYVGALLAELQ